MVVILPCGTSDLGTPVFGRRDSSEIGVDEFSLDDDLANPIENLVKYRVYNIEEGLFMAQAVREQFEGFPRNKIHADHFDLSVGINSENGSSSKLSFLSGNDSGLFAETDHAKFSRHTRRLSTDSVSSEGSSLRGSESSISAMRNSSGNGYLRLPGGTELSNYMENCGTTDKHTSANGQVILPLDQRHKMNRALLTMQRRLLTARTDMEGLIVRLNQEIAVKDFLTTKVKDLEVELESTKQKSRENLQQAILAERERFTKVQWDMEELQDGETATEGSASPSDDRKDALHQELEAMTEQLLSLQKNYEELEARSKADLRVLVKEVKALRNSDNNLKMKLRESLEEKYKFEVCIFAYGQTGSGKTYTMMGKPDTQEQKGFIPRSLEQIFQTSRSLLAQGWKYKLQASMLEIYGETIRELLVPNKASGLGYFPRRSWC